MKSGPHSKRSNCGRGSCEKLAKQLPRRQNKFDQFPEIMERKYHFTKIKGKSFKIRTDKKALDYLLKWSMKGQIHLEIFAFNEPYEPHKRKEFSKDLFRSTEVAGSMAKTLSNWSYATEDVEDVETELVPCTQTSLTFFDRILDPENGIVRHGGGLHHCVDDVIDDFVVSDELRKMILDENSDNYGMYNEDERKEFLFRIFQHLVLGGKWCQFEDKVEPYLEMTKLLYKDLVQVQRNSGTKDVEIRSICLKVKVRGGNNKSVIFPRDADHAQNFIYVLVDPVLRHATMFAHEFGGQF